MLRSNIDYDYNITTTNIYYAYNTTTTNIYYAYNTNTNTTNSNYNYINSTSNDALDCLYETTTSIKWTKFSKTLKKVLKFNCILLLFYLSWKLTDYEEVKV